MNADEFKSQFDAIQSRIFQAKLTGMGIKEQIELEKNRGLSVKLQTQQVKTQTDQVGLGTAQDQLKTSGAKRELGQQKARIELEGLARELPLLKESVEIRLAALKQRNIKSLMDD